MPSFFAEGGDPLLRSGDERFAQSGASGRRHSEANAKNPLLKKRGTLRPARRLAGASFGVTCINKRQALIFRSNGISSFVTR